MVQSEEESENEKASESNEEDNNFFEQNASEPETIYESFDSETPLNPLDEQSITPSIKDALENECNLNKKFRDTLNDSRSKTIDQMLESNIMHDLYDKTLNVITIYYKKIDKDSNDDTISKLFDWFFNIYDTFPKVDMNLENDYYVWQNLSKHDQLRTFSITALKLISIGTSESDVERLISMHRYIVHDRMSNMSDKVLLARLRMRVKAISDNCTKKKMIKQEKLNYSSFSDYSIFKQSLNKKIILINSMNLILRKIVYKKIYNI